AHSTVSLIYDGADRLVSETLNGRTTSYSYAPNALTRQINYPGGKQVLETYDERARLIRLDDNSLPSDPLAEFIYDPANRLLELIYANGTGSEFGYDINSNSIQIDHSLSGSPVRFQYDHDANDNKLFEQNVNQPTKSNQFIYDIYNRLTQFKTGTLSGSNIPAPVDNILYNYDAAHNRTTSVLNGATTTYASNTLNQYTMLSGAMSASLTYDNNGNLLADGLHTYSYDFENRLSAIDGGATGKYFYDALGRRILKVVGADSTFFFYAETKVIEELGNGGALEAAYVFGEKADEVLTMERGGNRYFFYQNALCSVTHVANYTGALVERYEYDAYGNVAFFNGAGASIPVSAIENPCLFTGQRWDAESGLYFYKSRYYSPRLGRFLQRDPLDYVDGPSLYEYAYSNPVNFTDPLGLCSTPCNKKPWWETPLDWFQTGLDVAGLIPGVGEIADGLNAGIYAARGDYVNAALSAAAMIPGAGWGATAAKYANKADNFADAARAVSKVADGRPPIIIGENMARVKAYADDVGGHAYQPWKNDPFDYDLGMRRNERWIQDQMRDGREIIDIGPDFQRRAERARRGEKEASDFYEMERRRTKDYENYRKEFDRNGKYNDGKEGARPPRKDGGCR
ncbi:MAG: RHS repeat-associated core domain-containing protein, partial [Bacteroidota bacterium]